MMGSENVVNAGAPTVAANGGAAALLSWPELQCLFASVQQQVEQLARQRDQLAETVQKLEVELAGQRETVNHLQAERDKYKELARAFMEAGDPLGQVIEDFKNYPPVEQCIPLETVVEELEQMDRAEGS
jgi:hypothetical protein